jgi:hypothetical protein
VIRFNERPGGPMEKSFPTIHPELQVLLADFAAYSSQVRLPEPVVTDLVRNVAEQVRIYTAHYRRLQESLKPGPHQRFIDPEGDGTWRPLKIDELNEAREIRNLDDAELMKRASEKFSLHQVGAAFDLRIKHYSKAQWRVVFAWFARRCVNPPGRPLAWEMLPSNPDHPHDTAGTHLHVGRKDREWQDRFISTLHKPPLS